MLIPILFALGTALFWGCYGPTIGNAQAPRLDGKPLAPPDGWTPFKPYVFIGVAYLLISVVGGSVMMKVRGDSFNFTAAVPGVDGITHFNTAKWGFLAGCLGALGALCLTTAMMTSRGNALLVMPIVFGGAVSVTAIVSILKLRSHGPLEISPLLWVGMALTVVGVVLVAMNTPHGHAAAKPKTSTETSESPHAAVDQKDAESNPESTS
ncbi:MAG: hypothetical protein P8M30_02160 [Planctomycetaceae bacterium]|nr:hypothetical protein [bacterium]MDC0273568.1 hypothetical protein [Planctomycetaceae bacterium]MDG2388101.1 hypothetical protein [Planctomycetaceae bacterium]